MKDSEAFLFDSAYFYLKFRPRTKKEITTYLTKKCQKKKIESSLVDRVINRLEVQKFVDDKEFIKWFVEQRNSGKPKSTFVLEGELLRLGIEKDLIVSYFESHTQNEEELAYKALQPKWHRLNLFSNKDRFRKAVAFLARRGFSFDTIKKTIEKMGKKEYL